MSNILSHTYNIIQSPRYFGEKNWDITSLTYMLKLVDKFETTLKEAVTKDLYICYSAQHKMRSIKLFVCSNDGIWMKENLLSIDHPVWVEHRNDLEDVEFSKRLRQWLITHEEVNRTYGQTFPRRYFTAASFLWTLMLRTMLYVSY